MTNTGNNMDGLTKTKELTGLKYTRKGGQLDTGGRNPGNHTGNMEHRQTEKGRAGNL